MADFVKFNKFLEHLAKGYHNLSSGSLKFALTNVAPVPASQESFDPVTNHAAPAAANGYTAGGHAATISSCAESGGTLTLGSTTDVVITATTGGIGPFRYVVLYNDTPSSPVADPLIGYWDYGSSITLAAGQTFTIDVTNSILTLT